MSNRPIPKTIFLHIHKTGGMSLRGLFVKNYRKGRHFNTGLVEMDPPMWNACLDRVRQLGPSDIADYQVFKGHMPFGLHTALPTPSRYITFLRNPVKRALSHYRMILRKNLLPHDHQLDPSQLKWNLGACPELARSLDNGQTRALSGADLHLPFGRCTEEHLQIAKNNLDRHFDFVGLTEHFDLSLLLLQRLCGWKNHFYVPDNVAPQSPDGTSPDILEQVRVLNRFDAELYCHAAERFHQLVTRFGWRLQLEHRAFVAGNALHQHLHCWRQSRKARHGIRARPAMHPLPITELKSQSDTKT